ncbi:MAG: SH3 domain-containing protein [Patescibacteria group bacterium]
MKILVRLYLSLEKLFTNPVAWSAEQPWGIRMIFVLITLPLIATSSIVVHESLEGGSSEQIRELLSDNKQQISNLKEAYKKDSEKQLQKIEELNQDIDKLKMIVSQSSPRVLGSSEEEQTKMIYVSSNLEEVEVLAQAQEGAEKIGVLPANSLYFYLQKQDSWYQIEIDNNITGWINDKFVIKFP